MGHTLFGNFRLNLIYWFDIKENIFVIIEGADCFGEGRLKQY
jgi:hypothetical protein